VGSVGTFVAEVAVDFVDAFDAADHCSLEEKFRCDSEKQFGVEGIRVGLERTSAGTTVRARMVPAMSAKVSVSAIGWKIFPSTRCMV
jgi:hypothetical protein